MYITSVDFIYFLEYNTIIHIKEEVTGIDRLEIFFYYDLLSSGIDLGGDADESSIPYFF